MKKSEMNKIMKEIESIMNENNIQIEKSEDGKILISDRKRNEIISYLENEISEDDQNLFFEKKIQIHEKKDKDIKIESKKIGIYGIKLIYHRKKDDSKEYRIFISFKEDNRLIRKRLINNEIKNIQNDEKKMIEYFNSIQKESDIKIG